MKKVFFTTLLLFAIPLCYANLSMEYIGKRTRLFCNNQAVDFAGCVKEEMRRHPESRAQDWVKFAYQAAWGAGHGIPDRERAWKVFSREFAAVKPEKTALFEIISPDYCRINLGAWKERGLPAKWLFNMFCASAEILPESEKLFDCYIRELAALPEMKRKELDKYMKTYRGGAVHHSRDYRGKYYPSYRVVNTRFLTALPVLEAAAELPPKAVTVIAVDGRAASGKSTLARQLEIILEAAVIHMDDFFLPEKLRTPERFATPGGNVHYERFKEEILPALAKNQPFEYRKFDCSTMTMGTKSTVAVSRWRIVEGAYSLHPEFGNYADLKLFFDIAPAEQMKRIRKRNGEKKAQIFAARWIPLEENYIKWAKPDKRADIILGRP